MIAPSGGVMGRRSTTVAITSGAEPRTRRAVLFGALGAFGALAARSIGATSPTEGSNAMQLGASNPETSATVVRNTSTTSGSIGLVGRSVPANGVALQGVAEGNNGKGVSGVANSGTTAAGVVGTSAQGHGVQGSGVVGVVASGTATGVSASAPSATGTGVVVTSGNLGVHVTSATSYAFFNDAGPSVGVYAQGSAAAGYFTGGTYGSHSLGTTYGVKGVASATSDRSYGLYGDAIASTQGIGVYGTSTYLGIRGEATGPSPNVGVEGHASGSSTSIGVIGVGPYVGVQGGTMGFLDTGATGVAGYGNNNGVYGQALATNGNYGVYCAGNSYVTGTQTVAEALLTIDHPRDPEHQWLSHALIGAPEPLNVYRGSVILDAKGGATVKLPGYFSALNGDPSYQLTAVGAAAPNLHVIEEVRGNQFRIDGGGAGQKVCWQVTGVRRDAYTVAHPLKVEARKGKEDQGTLKFVPEGSHAEPMRTGPRAIAKPRS
jgi:hypothetical protein